MNKHKVTQLAIIILSVALLAPPSFANGAQEVEPKMLPMLLIQYAFSSGYSGAPQGVKLLQLQELNQALEIKLTGTGFDLPTRLAFVGESFVVQQHSVGNKYIGFKTDSVLYVTTPINAVGGKVIAIVSSSGPERTTIFELGRDLDVIPVYDSIGLNKFDGAMRCDPIGHIDSVIVSNDQTLLLNESSTHFSDKKRQFLLKIINGAPVLVCK